MSPYLRAVANPRPLSRAEAQCTNCGQVFGSYSTCDKHKRWAGGIIECRHPSKVGLEARERRGMVVWVSGWPRDAANLSAVGNGGNVEPAA